MHTEEESVEQSSFDGKSIKTTIYQEMPGARKYVMGATKQDVMEQIYRLYAKAQITDLASKSIDEVVQGPNAIGMYYAEVAY